MFGKVSFKGGVHPPGNKQTTASSAIEMLPAPEKVFIPLSMHTGTPAKIAVKIGDKVKIGQVLGEANGFYSSSVHASVSGEVASISPYPHPSGQHLLAVGIVNDGKDEMVECEPLDKSWREAAPGEIIQKIQACGIVGMGGAGIPTHVKLSPPSEKKIDTLIINGAESEPCLTADHRLILEKTEQILCGMMIMKKTLGARHGYVGIEDKNPDAFEAVKKQLADQKYSGIECVKLQTKYPQGGEKQIIKAITKREVPSGGQPMDVGCVVQNVATSYAVWDAVCHGLPLYQRTITVCGPLVKKPANLLVRIGTPVRYILEYCQTDIGGIKKLIMGGPMMGLAQAELDVPVIKTTTGLLTSTATHPGIKSYNCLNCGHCLKACPMSLNPSLLAKYIEKKMYSEAKQWNVLDCMECGSCSYVCPSKINLVHYIKLGKYHVVAAKQTTAIKQ